MLSLFKLQIMKKSINYIVILVITYLMTAFIYNDIDFANWKVADRFLMLLIVIIASFLFEFKPKN